MKPAAKKLGLMIAAEPTRTGFRHAVNLARTALARGMDVYAYCIDEGVRGVPDADLQELRGRGLKLHACAYSARQRNLPIDDRAAYSGLITVHELIAATDRFVSFN